MHGIVQILHSEKGNTIQIDSPINPTAGSRLDRQAVPCFTVNAPSFSRGEDLHIIRRVSVIGFLTICALFEICVDSAAAALKAEQCGADRIELCSSVKALGGVTPSAGTILATIRAVKIPVMVIIRPRGGDFLYDELEFESMIEDVKFAKEAGAHGVVLGILTKDGEIDLERNKRLISLARPMEVTFHRAFDMAADPHVALDKLIEIDADRVLTSGQQKTALQGAELLADLQKAAAGRLIIMPGCGVNEKTVGDIVTKVQPKEVHLSALKTIVGGMAYRNVKASMSTDASSDQEYSIDIADGDKIKAVIDVLEKC